MGHTHPPRRVNARAAASAPRPAPARTPVLVALVLLVTINVIALPLRTAAAPAGMLTLQLTGDPTTVEAIVASWRAAAWTRTLWAHGLDLLFPVVAVVAVRRLVGTSTVAAGTVATGAVLTAAVADQVENVATLVTLLGEVTATGVGVTVVAAGLKWAAYAVAGGALGATWAGRRREGSR